MIIEIPTVIKKNITHIKICAPVRYEEEEIPNDFPLRDGNMWRATINVDTGKIEGWPDGRAEKMHLTVKDCGVYKLISDDGREVISIDGYYVPHGIVPGSYGDTIEMDIQGDGTITNWPKHPDASDFTERGEE